MGSPLCSIGAVRIIFWLYEAAGISWIMIAAACKPIRHSLVLWLSFVFQAPTVTSCPLGAKSSACRLRGGLSLVDLSLPSQELQSLHRICHHLKRISCLPCRILEDLQVVVRVERPSQRGVHDSDTCDALDHGH